MDGSFKRTERVNQLLRQELADLLTNHLMDPRVGFVTVTEVRCSEDLRNARVFVSIYGTDEGRAQTLSALGEAAGYLRRELGKRVRLHHLPHLTFTADETLERAHRLDELLHAAHDGAPEAPTPTVQEALPVRTPRTELAERDEELSRRPAPPPAPSKRRARSRSRHARRS